MLVVQTFADQKQIKMMSGSKTLGFNPRHPIIQDLLKRIQDDPEDKTAKKMGETLFAMGMVASGFDVDKPADFSGVVYRMVSQELGVDPEKPQEDPAVLPDDDVEEIKEDEVDLDEDESAKPTTEESSDDKDDANEKAKEDVEPSTPGKDEL